MEENIRAMLDGIRQLGDAGPIPDTPTPAPTTDDDNEFAAATTTGNQQLQSRKGVTASSEGIELSAFSVMTAALKSDASDAVSAERKRDYLKQAAYAHSIGNELYNSQRWKTVDCSFKGIELSEIAAYPCHFIRDPVCPVMNNVTVSRAICVLTGVTATKLATRLKDANHISRLKWDKFDTSDIAQIEEISADADRHISLDLQWELKKASVFQRPARDRLYLMWAAGSLRTSPNAPDDREWKLIWKSIDSNSHPKRPLQQSSYKRDVFMQMMILTPILPLTVEQIIPVPRISVTLIGWDANYPTGSGISYALSERLDYLQKLEPHAFSLL